MAKREDVYCTLLMSDSYLPGAAVLAHSLRDNGTSKKLAVLCTVDGLLYNTLTELRTLFDYVIPVEKVANPNLENLVRLDRLDLRFTFSKIALWKQEQFRKIVYLDADVVALRAPDELFRIDAPFAAAPDIGWPDCFNSGVMVLSPNMGDYSALQTLAASGTSFDGADQGLLNQYFGGRPWHRLSYTYNCTPNSNYQYEPAYRHFRSSINMTHFLGRDKPWQNGRSAFNAGGSGVYKELLGSWWAVYDRHYTEYRSSSHDQVSQERYLQQFVKDEKTNSVNAVHADRHSNSRLKAPEGPTSPLRPPTNTWDATTAGPPSWSQPEAGSFTTRHYSMSHDAALFKDPDQKPLHDRPKPIFPWEETARKPTRVFADETSLTTQPPPRLPNIASSTYQQPSHPVSSDPTIQPTQGNTVQYDALPRSNAWDNDTSIDHYVRAVKASQIRQGSVQVLQSNDRDELESPTGDKKKPESLILTDFPTDVERPSLPVTPLPRQPLTFWGGERDEHGKLPAAAGVPDQTEWDPNQKLEELRRSSLIAAEELPKSPPRYNDPLPTRDVPRSSANLAQRTSPPPTRAAQRQISSPPLAPSTSMEATAEAAQTAATADAPSPALTRPGGGGGAADEKTQRRLPPQIQTRKKEIEYDEL